jgi:hypothetical protein
MDLQQPASSYGHHDDYWTTVLSDFRRSVSNLVLFLLESIPMPWVFPQPPVAASAASYPMMNPQPQMQQPPTALMEEGMLPPPQPQLPQHPLPPVTEAELEEWFMHPLPTTTTTTMTTTAAGAPTTPGTATLVMAAKEKKPSKRAPRKKVTVPQPQPQPSQPVLSTLKMESYV